MFEPGETVKAIVNIFSGISVAIFHSLKRIIYFFSVLVVKKVFDTCYDGHQGETFLFASSREKLY